jgi:hypothetical protein
MNIQCRDSDIRDELAKVANKSPSTPLKDSEQGLCACFDYIPSEDYDELYRLAKIGEMKANAFEDVMMLLLKYINFLVENTNVLSSSRLVITAYQDTFNAAISRIETLERNLETQETPTVDFF